MITALTEKEASQFLIAVSVRFTRAREQNQLFNTDADGDFITIQWTSHVCVLQDGIGVRWAFCKYRRNSWGLMWSRERECTEYI